MANRNVEGGGGLLLYIHVPVVIELNRHIQNIAYMQLRFKINLNAVFIEMYGDK